VTNIKGSNLRLLTAAEKTKHAKDTANKVRQAKRQSRNRKFKAKIDTAVGNATSRRARTPNGKVIGAKPKADFGTRAALRYQTGLLGTAGGLTVGTPIGQAYGSHKYPESKKFKAEVNKKLTVPKRPIRITDLGTSGAKYQERAEMGKWPELPRKTLIAGLGAGAALGGATGAQQKKGEAAYVKAQQRKRKAQVKKKYEKVPNKMESGKRYAYSNEGARARQMGTVKANYKFKGPHGKENKQIQRNATLAGTGIGVAGGAAVARSLNRSEFSGPLTRGSKAGIIGGVGAMGAAYGTTVGQIRRQARASRRTVNEGLERGDVRALRPGEKANMRGVIERKKVKKNFTQSAFGVDHG